MDEKWSPTGRGWQNLSLLRTFRRLRPWERLLFSIPLLATAAVAYLHLTSPPPSISLANYERIAEGMKEREVEGFIRARPGGYGYFVNEGRCLVQAWGSAVRWSRWGDSYGILEVGYDAENRVCCKRLEYDSDVAPAQPDQWPWWRRLLKRSVPSAEPRRLYTHF